MKYKTAADILRVIKDRRLFVTVDPGPPPMPRLHGNTAAITPALLSALKAWRLEVIAEVQKGGAK